MKNGNSTALSILTITTSLLIIHFITKWDWPIVASLVIGVISVIFPKVAMKIEYAWKTLTKFLGVIVQHVILILIYYLFLFPIALAARLIGKRDPLQLSTHSRSTFIEINKTFDKQGFEKPW